MGKFTDARKAKANAKKTMRKGFYQTFDMDEANEYIKQGEVAIELNMPGIIPFFMCGKTSNLIGKLKEVHIDELTRAGGPVDMQPILAFEKHLNEIFKTDKFVRVEAISWWNPTSQKYSSAFGIMEYDTEITEFEGYTIDEIKEKFLLKLSLPTTPFTNLKEALEFIANQFDTPNFVGILVQEELEMIFHKALLNNTETITEKLLDLNFSSMFIESVVDTKDEPAKVNDNDDTPYMMLTISPSAHLTRSVTKHFTNLYESLTQESTQ